MCSQNASTESFAVEVIETSVVVLTSATAKFVESSSASLVNYPYFTLDNVPNYGIKKQLDLLEVASSDF